jgi:transcriptional regulator with XRE-family HTH domain
MGLGNVALSSLLRGLRMQPKDSLAAVLRVVRRVRGLKAEDFSGHIDPTHVNNLENAKVSVTIDTLEAVASALNMSTISLLVLAESLRNKVTSQEILADVKAQVREFSDAKTTQAFADQFEDGRLVSRPSGAQLAQEKLAAVLACKTQGLSQKETVAKLGIPTSTVQRYWHKK